MTYHTAPLVVRCRQFISFVDSTFKNGRGGASTAYNDYSPLHKAKFTDHLCPYSLLTFVYFTFFLFLV